MTTPGFVEMAREAWVDPALAFFVLAALASFSSMYEHDQWRGWRSLAFYFSVVCAVLSKGPIGYILPGLVILAYLAVQQQLSRVRDLLWLPGLALAIGLPFIWYLLAIQQEGWAFIQKQVLQENLVRFTAGSGKRIPSAAFFLQPFFRDSFPWGVLFCVGLWNFSRHAPVREKGVFPLVWWFTVLIFFSISAGKREVYLLPAYPAMSLFVAEWGWSFVPAQTRPLPTLWRASLRTIAVGIVTLILVGALLAIFGQITPDSLWLDRVLGRDKWDSAAIYFRFLVEHPVYGVCVFISLCVGIVWAVYTSTAGKWRIALWVILGSLLLTTMGMYPFTRAYSKEFRAFTGFAEAMKHTVPSHEPLHFYTPEPYSSESDEFSQVYFYLDRHVPLAPCAEQPDLSQCEPGYYLLRDRYWQQVKRPTNAQLLLDSTNSAGPNAEARLLLVHLSSR
jgi:hypothetical protein